ncbi:hypothetical protein KVR01_002372 [Diaporthe batatas]|uniref:uncharacterized protein n=1 Tax=Diaporthe batatas TaxID=748121 RepID=UPI001D050778|nr:uncharacterized protein KVR01_002372 [Diaporthe batatas]KAG8166683.1 hypothetical protein KVR01_002372 [Diaporthe batatas]
MAPAEPNTLPFQAKGQEPHFPEELEGWKGYIEWEKYPEKKKEAEAILDRYDFPDPPEYQLQHVPPNNPLLTGERFKQYHYALGPTVASIPDISWNYVLEEKSKDMIHVLQFPYNGEPPRDRLVENPITSNADFFVRNHGGVPEIDADRYTLEIGGFVKEPKRITLAELQNEDLFPRKTMTVSLQCSGTRRIEQIRKYPGDGDELINAPWGEGAIGTATWTGVSLKKVIKYCGGLTPEAKAGHLEFFGADTYFKKKRVMNYRVSVPWRKVKANEVLLAWEMNGKPLPRIHGYPLRTVVCGYIGARSCKWLYRIDAISEPSLAPVQRKEYLYYTTQVGKQNSMYSNGFSIQDMPVSSAIMSPVEKDQIIHDGKIKLRGWAYSGGGRWPVRVEVSGDGGSIWYEVPYDKMSKKYYHAWRLWELEMPVDAEGWLEFCVRTWDNALNTQPTFTRSAWNWDLHVTINRSRPATAARLKMLEEKGLSIIPITKPLEFDLETDDEWRANMEARDGRDPEE